MKTFIRSLFVIGAFMICLPVFAAEQRNSVNQKTTKTFEERRNLLIGAANHLTDEVEIFQKNPEKLPVSPKVDLEPLTRVRNKIKAAKSDADLKAAAQEFGTYYNTEHEKVRGQIVQSYADSFEVHTLAVADARAETIATRINEVKAEGKGVAHSEDQMNIARKKLQHAHELLNTIKLGKMTTEGRQKELRLAMQDVKDAYTLFREIISALSTS